MMSRSSSTFCRLTATPLACAICSINVTVVRQLAHPLPSTLISFMMSVIALSFPEMVILRKVLKLRLIATFVGVVAAGILIVGYVFNAVL